MDRQITPVTLDTFRWAIGGLFAFILALVGIIVTAFDRMEDKNDKRIIALEERVRMTETQLVRVLSVVEIRTPGPR